MVSSYAKTLILREARHAQDDPPAIVPIAPCPNEIRAPEQQDVAHRGRQGAAVISPRLPLLGKTG